MFLFLHLGRAPGILWLQHEHPALTGSLAGFLAACRGLGPWAARLAALAGLPARSAAADATTEQRAGEAEHLLVHQLEGAATWSLAGAGECGARTSLRYRLRTGEVLYVPAGWSRRVEFTGRACYVVTRLGPVPGGPVGA
ncbi:hypothetical protein [Streptomyces sp. G-G2]|uniref:hypothetical protein n=1 Tax=Streptomyces sp. G-G2 TaxID=3046201 RepID=UPI0024B9AC8F|nr:hypothetical protein [Streptomyces sp. G-G2]MDJ0381080.1 hypothetical protein [Streptomyces sp. G-G2]